MLGRRSCGNSQQVKREELSEELVFGRCSMSNMDWGDAVRLIQQRKRIEERAKARAARGEEPTGPVSQAEAYELLGVSQGCPPKEPASYRSGTTPLTSTIAGLSLVK